MHASRIRPARVAARTLRVGYILPVQSQPGAGATVFAEEVARRTGGRIIIRAAGSDTCGASVG